MHKIRIISVLLGICGLLLLTATSFLELGASPTPQTRYYDVEAYQYGWNISSGGIDQGGTIIANKGDTIRITLTTADLTHGLYIDGYGVNEAVAPGETVVFEFIADETGHFKIRCSVNCGNLHPYMMGKLLVEPNNPLPGALVSMILVTLATLGWVWGGYIEEDEVAASDNTQSAGEEE